MPPLKRLGRKELSVLEFGLRIFGLTLPFLSGSASMLSYLVITANILEAMLNSEAVSYFCLRYNFSLPAWYCFFKDSKRRFHIFSLLMFDESLSNVIMEVSTFSRFLLALRLSIAAFISFFCAKTGINDNINIIAVTILFMVAKLIKKWEMNVFSISHLINIRV